MQTSENYENWNHPSATNDRSRGLFGHAECKYDADLVKQSTTTTQVNETKINVTRLRGILEGIWKDLACPKKTNRLRTNGE